MMPERLSASDPRVQQALGKKPHKYHARRSQVGAVSFDSAKEARRFVELLTFERAGLLRDLRVHPVYELHCAGVKVARYVADFDYHDTANGELIVEDVKSPATRKIPTYRLKRRMMAAEHGVQIQEIV